MFGKVTLVLTTAATFFAAFAAWFSFYVAKKSLDFQKNYAKNQVLLAKLNALSETTITLKSYLAKPLKISDEQFSSIESKLTILKASLEELVNLGEIEANNLKILSINSSGELAENRNCLDEVLSILQKRINAVFG